MLIIKNLDVCLGKVNVLNNISLSVSSGEIIAITGPNSAGKSSVLNAITGHIRPVQGSISYNGDEISKYKIHKIMKKGIVQVPQGQKIFSSLTVRENLLIGGYHISSTLLNNSSITRMMKIFPSLTIHLNMQASNLSGGQAQLLALARGLITRPTLLLLDEPTQGLSPKVTNEVFSTLEKLKREGLAIIIVEQNIKKIMSISNRIYVIKNGSVFAESAPSELVSSSNLIEHVFGF